MGWGIFVGLVATSAACTLLTPLDGLTGGDPDAGADASPSQSSDSGPGGISLDATSIGTTDGGMPAEASGGSPDASKGSPPNDGGPGTSCAGGGILCKDACVDPASDPSNCNGCGNVCATGLCGTGLSASMLSAPPGWSFNGSAAYNSFAPSGELTVAAVPGQAGTLIYQDAIAVEGLDVQFEFRMGLQGGTRSDGMGFLIEQTGPTAVGNAGSSLGMAGLSGFGVELDIYDNAICGDTSDDHVGVDDLTICNASEGTPTSLFETDVTSQLDLADTHWHAAEISIVSGAVSLSIDGTSLFSDVPLPGFQRSAPYYIGFAGATGGLVDADGGGGYRQEVKDVVVTFPAAQCL